MAITARFAADFSSFYSAVDKADAKLTDFTAGAGRVEKALSRMTDQFSGRRVIQEATLMEKAVAEIGGASKLTVSELDRVSAKASEAVDKLRAMGADVPAGLQRLADATKKTTDATGGFASKLTAVNGLLGGLGIGLSVGAVVSFGKALLDDADALTKMSDRTGVSITGLQRLQVAGDDAGNSIEEMTGAINQMQNRLASGDQSAVVALRKLNVDLAELQQMAPDKQFIAISDALRGIQDPAQQVALSMDLFGKQGASVLPTLKRGFDDVRDASVGMSEDTVKALDTVGDTFSRITRDIKGYSAEGIVALARWASDGFNPFTHAVSEARREMKELEDSTAALVAGVKSPKLFEPPDTSGIKLSASTLKDFNRELDEQRQAQERAAAAQKRASDELKKYNDAVREVLESARPYADILAEIDGTIIEGVRYYNQKGIAVERLAKMYGLTTPQVEALNSQLKIEALVAQAAAQQIGSLAEGVGMLHYEGQRLELPDAKIVKFGKVVSDTLSTHLPQSLGSKLSGVMQSIPGTLASAFTGGGGFKGAFLSIGSQLGSTVGEGIGKGVAMLGKLGGPIGAAIGSLAGPLIGKLVGLFSKAEKQVNPVRQAFVDAAGGLATLNQRAAEAGVTLRAMLDAKNPEQYKKAIDELNAAFAFQDGAMRKLDDAVKKYGFSLEELGPALQRQALDKQAQALFQDFQVLTSAGIGVDTVIGKMGASIQAFVADALRTGSEIPAAMAPMLKRMAEMGILTDQNGNVIADLESAGVKFAMTMSEGFQRMIDEVKKLTDAISRGLGLAIANIPDPEITGRVKWEVDAVPGGVDRTYENDWSQTPVYPMANGGDFMVKRPTLFLAGEAGAERATFTPMGDGGSAPMSDVDALRQEIAGLRQQQREQQTYFVSMFPRDLARAVRDERQKQTYRRAS